MMTAVSNRLSPSTSRPLKPLVHSSTVKVNDASMTTCNVNSLYMSEYRSKPALTSKLNGLGLKVELSVALKALRDMVPSSMLN